MTNRTLLIMLPLAVWFGTAGCGDLGNVNPALAVRYAPDGTLVVYAGDTIDLYDEQLATQMKRIPVKQAHGAYLGEFSLSDDGTLAAVPDYDGNANRSTIDLYRIPSGDRPPSIDLGPPPDMPQAYVPEDLALSPHGDLVYVMGGVAGGYRLAAMFDTGSGAMLWPTDWAIAPAFSLDGSQLYVSGKQGQDLLGFDARSGAPILDAPIITPPDGMSPTADPNTLVGLLEGTIALLSTSDGSVISQFAAVSATEALTGGPVLGLPAFRCSAPAGLCALGVDQISAVMSGDPPTPLIGGPSRVKVWSLTGTLFQTLLASASDLAISPDGQFLAIANSEGDAQVFRISDGSLVNSHHYGGRVF